MPLNKQEQKLIDQVLRNAPITNRARDVLRKLYLIAESDVYTVSLTKENKSLPTTTADVVTYTDSGTTISVYRGDTQLTGITSGTPTTGQFKVLVSAANITPGAQSVTDTHNITLANSSNITATSATINLSINAENVTTLLRVFSLTKSLQGATGATGATGPVGKTVSLSAGAQIISYNAAGDNGTGTITLTATSQNFTNAYFKFTGGGGAFSDEGSYTDGAGGANSDTATFTIPGTYSATPYTFTVSVQEGSSGGEVASDTVTIGSIQPGTDGDDGATGSTGSTGAVGADAFPNDILELEFAPAASFTVASNSESWYKDSDGSTGFNAHFNSKATNAYDGQCFASFIWAPGGASTRATMKVGISSSVAPADPGGESLISIFYSSGAWRGRLIQTGVSVATFGTVAAGDRFSLRYDGTETTFYQNGSEISAASQPGRFIKDDTTVPSNLGGWILTGSMSTVGSADQISGVRFLP